MYYKYIDIKNKKVKIYIKINSYKKLTGVFIVHSTFGTEVIANKVRKMRE